MEKVKAAETKEVQQNVKAAETKEVQQNAHETKVKTPEEIAAFKAKKAEAAKRFKEKTEAEKAATVKAAQDILAWNTKEKKNMPANMVAVLEKIANPVVRSAGSGSTLFTKLFGDTPKVGDKITLLDAMSKSFKGKVELDRAIKAWAEKGITVEFKADPVIIKSVYEIVKLS